MPLARIALHRKQWLQQAFAAWHNIGIA